MAEVIQAFGAPAPATKYTAEIIETLEALLAQAKGGQLLGLAGVAFRIGGAFRTFAEGDVVATHMCGGLFFAQQDIWHANEAQNRGEDGVSA